jgi:hypothetical protein
MLITREDPVRHQAATRSGLSEYIGYFVVVAQHMMKLEAVELAFQISNDLTIRRHLWVDAVLILHDLIHDQLRVAPDLKVFNPELYNDSETIDQGLVLGGAVRCPEI